MGISNTWQKALPKMSAVKTRLRKRKLCVSTVYRE
jgi:hypothetical protein